MFKKLIAGTLAVAAIASASPVEARNLTSGQRNLENALHNAGITWQTSACSSTQSFGWFRHNVNRRGGHIQICNNVARRSAQQWETFRHEAVHVAQKCYNPHMTNLVMSQRWLNQNGASASTWSFIKSAYPQSQWAIEYEAFTLMKYSNQTIADLVNHYCN